MHSMPLGSSDRGLMGARAVAAALALLGGYACSAGGADSASMTNPLGGAQTGGASAAGQDGGASAAGQDGGASAAGQDGGASAAGQDGGTSGADGAGGESPNCTRLASASGSITDASGNVWTLGPAADGTLVVYENGALAGFSKNVVALVYVDHVVSQENAGSNWWSWTAATWQAEAAPDTGCAAGNGAPAPAVAAGFTRLAFEDDFTTPDSIAPTRDASSGYKWYWSTDTNPWSVDTAATAASIANGNHGGGANASARGGVLTMTGPGFPNGGILTVPGNALNHAGAVLPAEGDGCWSHGYFEAYLQFKIDGNQSTDLSNGWPAFWSWSAQGLKGYGYGSSSVTTDNWSEIDFMESYGTIFGNTPGNWGATMHQWPANASNGTATQHTDDEWHTYGCAWSSTGSGTGQVKFFFDNVQVGQTILSGANQTQFSLENMYQFVVLGTGVNWDMNVDWVHVWQ
jgi:hypothetical protein